MKAILVLAFLLFALATVWADAKPIRTTVVYDDAATSVSAMVEDSSQLWITLADLTRATRFEVKPQGVCRDEICIPLPKARKDEFLRGEAGSQRFNLVAFASLTHQAVAHDAATSTWYFGLRADQQQLASSLMAPDFTLPDINGKRHSLSDFRGKKVLLVTWASW
jgi:AhpC/TSA family protein